MKVVNWLFRLRGPYRFSVKEISFNGNDAGIEAGSSKKKKLDYLEGNY